MDPKRFGVRGQHYKVFPTALPLWTPLDKAKDLNERLKVKLRHEIWSMNVEAEGAIDPPTPPKAGAA
jgi:hypothetical protein